MRITFNGNSNPLQDLTIAPANALIAALDHDNLVVRFAAADQLVDRVGMSAAAPALALVNDEGASGREYIHALWVLHRLNALTDCLISLRVVFLNILILNL